MSLFEKENIENYKKEKIVQDPGMIQDSIIPDSTPFRAVDGSYHASMNDVRAINNAYWTYKNPIIIDKDSELFSAPLSKEELDRIVSSATYRDLIAVLENRFSQSLNNNESSSMKR